MLKILKKLLKSLFCCSRWSNITYEQGTSFVCILFCLVLFFPSCGRKNNNFFVFTHDEKPKKINKLKLPVVRGFDATRENKKVACRWNHSTLSWNAPDDDRIIGYNIYRFSHTAFIPKEPINTSLVTSTTYVDLSCGTGSATGCTCKNKSCGSCVMITPTAGGTPPTVCYTVRAVFSIDNREIEGPASKIVCVS